MGQKSILIVGGGIIGLWSAYHLEKQGFRVQIVDQGDFSYGCSYGNAGMIVPSHFIPLAAPGMILIGFKWMFNPETPFFIKPRLSKDLVSWLWKFYRASSHARVSMAMPLLKVLNLSSKYLYEQMAEESPMEFNYQPKGLFMYCRSKNAFEEERKVALQARKLGLKAEVLTKVEAQSMDPNFEIDVLGAVYYPQDAFLDPHQIMKVLKKQLLASGVVFTPAKKIHRIEQTGNQITAMYSDEHRLVADEYLIAAGTWSSILLKSLKLNVPIQAGKGYSVFLNEPTVKPEICSILTEAKVAVTPMARGLRIAGTMEISGLDETVNKRRIKGIFNSVP